MSKQNEVIKTVLETTNLSKSERMRRMYNGGIEISEIAKALGVRYNFVYNVVSNAARMSGVEIRKTDKGDSVKSKIVALIKDGKECGEISRELRCNINMVYKYRKEMEMGWIK